MEILFILFLLLHLSLFVATLFWFGTTAISAINLWMLGTGSIFTVASNLKIFVILFLIYIPVSAVANALLKSSDK